jgi:arylsulfatase A-like enzyme
LSIPKSVRKNLPKSRLYRQAISGYVAEIAFTDQEIARLLGVLGELGLADNTLVIITADHGEGLMEHGYLKHGFKIYQEEVHVPLVMRLPGKIPPGGHFENPVELMDLAPTALDLLGVDTQGEQFDGRNLAPALRGSESLDPQHPVLFYRRHYESGIYEGLPLSGELFGILRGSKKLIDHTSQETDEFFDLETDPGEVENLYHKDPEALTELRSALSKWRRRFHPANQGGADEEPLSEANRQALEALGYIESGSESEED